MLEYQLKMNGLNILTACIQSARCSATLSVIPQETGYDYFLKHEPNEDFEPILETLDLKPLPFSGRMTQVKL